MSRARSLVAPVVVFVLLAAVLLVRPRGLAGAVAA